MHSTPLEWISVTDALPKIDRPHPPRPYADDEDTYGPLVLVADSKGDTSLATYWGDNTWTSSVNEEWAHLLADQVPPNVDYDLFDIIAWAYLPARVSLTPDSVPDRLRRHL